MLAGCAGVQPPPPGPPPVDPAPYLARARAAEEKGDIQKAMAYLALADAMRPGDAQIGAQRAQLDAFAESRAARHFERGKAHFDKGNHRAAQREFMAALRYEPDHGGAMDYLRNRFSPPSATRYRVAAGDSLRQIAEKVYRDPKKSFLIAYFNDLKPGTQPQPGTTLLLPHLKGASAGAGRAAEKPGPAKPPAAVDSAVPDEMVLTIYEERESGAREELSRARDLMERRDYDRVIPLARLILEKDPSSEEAVELINAAFYQKGVEFDRRQKRFESLEMYEEVEPGYRDVDTRIAQAREALKKQAEEYYRQGVNCYVNENLAGAIDAWEKTLALDPDHSKAGQDMDKARLLLKKLQAIQ